MYKKRYGWQAHNDYAPVFIRPADVPYSLRVEVNLAHP